jgi:adenine-specific DNA-methyltransferase
MPILHWVGKDKVVNHHHDVPFRVLNKVSTFTAPAGLPANSTDNRIIHGDNLEALKSLLPEFEGKVKCIYIDPPYNTGNESWVYNDAVNDPKIKRWLGRVVGKEGEDLSRHDKWLCMMYPRLKLLHRLLRSDGVLFASIDDNEIATFRLVLDEIFGPQNFVAEMILEGAFKNDARQIGVNHEYILVYARKRELLPREWAVKKEGVEPVLKEVARLKAVHGTDFEAASQALAGWYRASKATPSFAHRRFRYLDARGAYKEDDPTAPGGRKFELRHPHSGQVIPLRDNRGWAFDQATFDTLVDEGRISFITPTSIMVRRYLHETDHATPQSVMYQPTRSASERLAKIIGPGKFEFPKDEEVIQRLVEMATEKNSIVLDSFAGSGTTGHAVLAQNVADGGNRRFLLIEMMPYAEGVTAERVRRAITGQGEGGYAFHSLGGAFSYYTVGEPMFLPDDNLNEAVGTEVIRSYVAYSEGIPAAARTSPENPHSPYLLGLSQETAWIFNYERERATSLDMDFLAGLRFGGNTGAKKPGTVIIFADRCLLSAAFMAKHGIVFKKIPRDITRF